MQSLRSLHPETSFSPRSFARSRQADRLAQDPSSAVRGFMVERVTPRACSSRARTLSGRARLLLLKEVLGWTQTRDSIFGGFHTQAASHPAALLVLEGSAIFKKGRFLQLFKLSPGLEPGTAPYQAALPRGIGNPCKAAICRSATSSGRRGHRRSVLGLVIGASARTGVEASGDAAAPVRLVPCLAGRELLDEEAKRLVGRCCDQASVSALVPAGRSSRRLMAMVTVLSATAICLRDIW